MTRQVATPHQQPSRHQAVPWAALLVTFPVELLTLHSAPMQAPSLSLMPVHPIPTRVKLNGYDTASCDTTSVAITAASCTLGRASGYTSSGTPGVTCGTNASTFTVAYACAANTQVNTAREQLSWSLFFLGILLSHYVA